VCGKELSGKQRRFCSKQCKGAESNNIHQSYTRQQERALARKLYFVRKSGAQCVRCGYKKNLSALCFHHSDPSLKSFSLTFRELGNNTINLLEKEAAKCELLCANCHAEEHYPRFDIQYMLKQSSEIKDRRVGKDPSKSKKCSVCGKLITPSSNLYCVDCYRKSGFKRKKSTLTPERLLVELETKSKLQITKDHHIGIHTINKMIKSI
jgi:hypothetical protein